jgi:hypothetical protein
VAIEQVHPGTLRAFDSGTYKATAGRKVVVFLTDPTKATDAVVIAVYT